MGVYGCINGCMISLDQLKINPEYLTLIAEIDEFKGAWRTMGSLAPERLNALRHIATIESIGSSTRIEGSKLSNQAIQTLLSNLKLQSFDSRDEQEVAGYAETMELVFQAWHDIPLTENHIRQLHRDLLKHSNKDSHHRGEYKTSSNNVAAFDDQGKQIGAVFETASPFDTPFRMDELTDWVNQALEIKRLHPLLVVAIFIVVFLAIHPFQDGNGRLSRILTTLLLLRLGYAYVPFSSLESIIEANKEQYYLALRQTQGTLRNEDPNWHPWFVFILRALREQTRKLAKKAEQEKILINRLPDLSVQILNATQLHGRVTMREMIELTGSSRNTLKEHFRSLVSQGYLISNGRGRGTWYTRNQ